MESESRIDLASGDFVLSSTKSSNGVRPVNKHQSMEEVWDVCNARLAAQWSALCQALTTGECMPPITAGFEQMTNEYLASVTPLCRNYVAAETRDHDVINALEQSLGTTRLLQSSPIKEKALKCLESIRNLSGAHPLSTEKPSGILAERNITQHRTQHLFCVGLRYLLPLAVAIEDFGTDGVYGCAAVMRDIASSYNSVAYHNGAHAALVTHHSVEICKLSGLWRCLDDRERVALIIASAGHDIGHPGMGASLFLKSGHPLAVIYNEKHVLENYHAARLIQILRSHNYAPAATSSYAAELKSMIVQCVLWTDLSDHPRIMAALQETMKAIRRSKKKGDALASWLQKSSKSSIRDLAGLVLKIADLSYFALPNPLLMIEWTIWLYSEIYAQRQIELDHHLPLCEAYGVNGLGTRKWFEANLSFCNEVLMPMTLCLASLESKLRNSQAVAAAEFLTLPTTAVKILADERGVDWHSTALALKQRDSHPLLDTVSPNSISEKEQTSTVMAAARWLAQQSTSVKRKSTAAIQSFLENEATADPAANSVVHHAIISPLLDNIELLKKAKYAN